MLYQETNWLSNYVSSGLLVARNYTIEGLEPDTNYNVVVVAISVAGEGERGAAMQVKTQPIGKEINYHKISST